MVLVLVKGETQQQPEILNFESNHTKQMQKKWVILWSGDGPFRTGKSMVWGSPRLGNTNVRISYDGLKLGIVG